LRYVFAGFIAQQATPVNVKLYRDNFQPADGPSGVQQPEVRLGIHVLCADSEEEARRQLAPVHVMYQNLQQGNLNAPLLTPDQAIDALGGLPALERYVRGSGIPPKFVGGTLEQVQEQLEQLTEDLSLAEIIVQDLLTDHQARLHSYELMAAML
jgi:alkanesulfonate monooxygenase SsuD/methylene tetrahydromethanopterin reductase-like flavin-dependent oxidoreductase (luciferase family)